MLLATPQDYYSDEDKEPFSHCSVLGGTSKLHHAEAQFHIPFKPVQIHTATKRLSKRFSWHKGGHQTAFWQQSWPTVYISPYMSRHYHISSFFPLTLLLHCLASHPKPERQDSVYCVFLTFFIHLPHQTMNVVQWE